MAKRKTKPASEPAAPKVDMLYDTRTKTQVAEDTFRASIKIPAGANDYVSRFLEIVKLIKSESPTFTIERFFQKNKLFEIPIPELTRLYDEWCLTMLNKNIISEVPSINAACGGESLFIFT